MEYSQDDWIPPSGQACASADPSTRKRKREPTRPQMPAHAGAQRSARNQQTTPKNTAEPPPPKQTKSPVSSQSSQRASRRRARDDGGSTREEQPAVRLQRSGIALPSRNIFDPWNSAARGHQRAEDNRLAGSAAWRDSRQRKLAVQYSAGFSGGERVADSVGAGSEAFGKDGRTATGGWEKGAKALRGDGQKSILECWTGAGKRHGSSRAVLPNPPVSTKEDANDPDTIQESQATSQEAEVVSEDECQQDISSAQKTGTSTIFKNTTIYINGYTGPQVSDHRLRYLINQHGGQSSLSLARKSVTHVILGKRDTHGDPSSGGRRNLERGKAWAGGSLAASKLQKELALSKVSGIKFVSAAWVLDSIEARRRLPESRYAEWAVGREEKQMSVKDVFGASKARATKDEKADDEKSSGV